jgi:3-hydroxybutyryl-CoA dehydrogenase
MNIEDIKSVAVIGAGTMGQRLTQTFAQVGLTTYMLDIDKLPKRAAQIEANLKLFYEYGLLKKDVETIMSRIVPVLTKDIPKVAKKCEFIIESIPEVLDLKNSSSHSWKQFVMIIF